MSSRGERDEWRSWGPPEPGEPDSGVWVRADRSKVPVSKMDTRHIQNCIAVLRRTQSQAEATESMIHGEVASEIVSEQVGSFFNWSENWIAVFERELAERLKCVRR